MKELFKHLRNFSNVSQNF